MMKKAIQSYFSLFIIRFSLLTFCTFSFSLITVAKQSKIDSLWNIWQDETKPDTTRLDAIYKFAWNGYLYSKPDSAFYFAQLEYDFAKRKGLKMQMAWALSTQGVSFWIRGNYPKALEYHQKSLAIQEELGNKQGIASSLGNIGLIYSTQDNYPKALEYYQKSLAIQEELGDKSGISGTLSSIGTIYSKQGNYPKALEYYKKSLTTAKELGYKEGIANDLNNIGIVYSNQGNYPKALEYFQKSLTIQKELGDEKSIAGSLINLGVLYKNEGNYFKALEYCEDGLELSKNVGVQQWERNACKCLYETYKATNNWQKAFEYFELKRELEDSLKKDETDKQLQKFEFERKILRDSLSREKEKRAIETAYQNEIRKKDETRNIAIGSGIFVLLLALGLWSRLRYTNKTKRVIEAERDRSESLLLNILPEEIAEELKEKGAADARDFEEVTILFTDFKEFTQSAEQMGASELVSEINECFKAFDGICEKYNVEKIKTIGDAYMAAGGLPVPDDQAVSNTVKAGLEMADFITRRKTEREAAGQIPFQMRVGIHTGPVVAGIVGVKKFQYDVWGDTVNTASRMESAGEVGKVNISQDTYEMIKDNPDKDGTGPQFQFEERGKVAVKGKGEIEMYFVQR